LVRDRSGSSNPACSRPAWQVRWSTERRQAAASKGAAPPDSARSDRYARFLSEAGSVLASLDYKTTLQGLTGLVVPALADACLVRAVAEDRRLQQVASAHRDLSKEAVLRSLERYPVALDDPLHFLARVVRTDTPEFHPHVTPALVESVAGNPEVLAVLRELAPASYLCVPLSAAGAPIGALSLLFAGSDRRYGSEELQLARELGRRAAAALCNAELYRASQRANQVKEEFLAIVSHELRTPLSAILGWARLLRRGKLEPPEVDRALETIERNVRAQAQIIDDILDTARVLAGTFRLELRPVRLQTIIEAAVETVAPDFAAKQVAIEALLEPDPVSVEGDHVRLEQVVLNLLSNALKFTDSGGRVEIRLERKRTWVRIVVRDTGRGISSDFLPHVFDRYSQAEAAPGTRSGLGLGLATVRTLVEMHKGVVSAESDGAGRGATFTVRLPLEPDPAMEDFPAGGDGRPPAN